MKTLKTAVLILEEQTIREFETIARDGELWLCGYWIEDRETKERWPARLVRLDVLAHKKLGLPQPFDFQLLDPIPKGILDGSTPSKEAHGYEVRDSPLLARPSGSTH